MNRTEIMQISETERVVVSAILTNYHQVLINEIWVIHNEKGPAITSSRAKRYALYGVELTEQEWLSRTSKLGKILYG
jgi:hypothetical protein